jgi:hypothetical protein
MSFSLPAYSKFNKRYIDPLFNNKNLIPAHACYFSEDLSTLQKYYKLPRSSNYTSSINKYNNLDYDLKEKFKIKFNSLFPFLNDNINVRQYIYPFSIDQFIKEYYSLYLPSEVQFITKKMIDLKIIISTSLLFEGDFFTALVVQPFTKEQYNSISSEWDSNYTFAGVAQSVNNIANITAQYKKDYKYLNQELVNLKNENNLLKSQLIEISQELLKATSHTWM